MRILCLRIGKHDAKRTCVELGRINRKLLSSVVLNCRHDMVRPLRTVSYIALAESKYAGWGAWKAKMWRGTLGMFPMRVHAIRPASKLRVLLATGK